jgi:acyl-CoA synthetase (AMP-forming)/AMP-acid ligase II
MASSNTNLPQANLCRHLKVAAIKTPTSLAVAVQKQQKKQLTYQEIDFAHLDQKSDDIAFALNDYGLKRGMKAVLMVTPSIDFFALTFALFKAGIVPILVDPGMGVKNLKQCFIESRPDAFIGIPKAHFARKLFAWGKPSVKFIITVGKASYFSGVTLTKLVKFSLLKRKLAAGAALKPPLNKSTTSKNIELASYNMALLDEDEMAAILFTSGSTGIPKGVVYSHKMFEAQISALKNDYHISPGERDLATFPLFSLFGPALGMASIVPDMDASKPITANPDFIFAAIERYQCSNLFANPALIEVLGQAGLKTDHQLPSLQRVISAGAPATLASIACFSKMLNTGIEVLNSYGATESLPLTKIGSQALLKTTDITDNGGGICVGKPVEGVAISIIAITEAEIPLWHDELALPINTVGEIVVKGAMVSQRYYQRESATKQAKIVDNFGTNDNNMVCHRMGDLGYLDAQGQLWMCGRKAHRVETENEVFFSIPCERIFNIHPDVRRTALVAVSIKGKIKPLLCIELNKNANKKMNKLARKQLFIELKQLGERHQQTINITDFILHKSFPVDIRHNAKIFREKLAVWAQKKYQGWQ